MITVAARFIDPWEAHVVCARLQAEGIPATLAFSNHAIANWPMSLALGGTAIHVPQGYLGQATRVIEEYRTGALESDLLSEIGGAPEHCPKCGSTQFKRAIPTGQRMGALILGLLTLAMFPTSLSKLTCQVCANTWSMGEG
nr:putative integron gene cassette protein [uncultured bacterium]